MVLGFWLQHDDVIWMWVFLACRDGFDRYEFLEDDQLVAKLTDQRFLLARGFVICDVSALIDHNLFVCMVVFLENDVIHASQFCSNKRLAETEQNVVVCSCSNCRCRRTSARHTYVYTIVAVTIMEPVRSHTNKTCASRSHTLH